MLTKMKKRYWLLMVAAMPGAVLVGCSHGKAPAAASAPAPTASAPSSSTPPGSATTAGSASSAAAGSAATGGTGPAAAANATNGVPARADLVLLAGAAFDGCKSPSAPPDPPDGHVATRAQMLSSHKLTADFNSATSGYLACLDQAANNFTRQYGSILAPAGARQVLSLHDSIHNKAIDADQAVADKFNNQLRVYKARGGAT